MQESIETFQQFLSKCFPLSQSKFEPIVTKFQEAGDNQELKLALIRELVTLIEEVYEQLLKSNQKLYVMFFDTITGALKDSAVRILQEPKFVNLRWEYDSLFLGNNKQLLVYKKNYELQVYLSKYKLPKPYTTLKKKVDETVEKLTQLKIKKNQEFSLDESFANTEISYQAELKKYQARRKDFMQLIKGMVEHFQSQMGRSRFTMKGISFMYKDEIKQIAEGTELMWDQSEVVKATCQYQVDMTKRGVYVERQSESYSQDQLARQALNLSIQDPVAVKTTSAQQAVQKTETICDQHKKGQKTTLPKKEEPSIINTYKLLSCLVGRATVQFEVPNDNGSPIHHFNLYRLQNNILVKIQQTTLVPGQSVCEILLEGTGYSEFTIKAENQLGQALRHQVFKIYIPEHSNRKLYMCGPADDQMITLPDGQDEQKSFVEQPIKVKLPVSLIRVNQCCMVCDEAGNLAAWGKVYNGQHKQNPNLEPAKPFQFTIKYIRRISCADDFYLCCDYLGNAYGIGSNSACQLGIPNLRGDDTINPIPIPYFRNNKVFVIDVACKGRHSLALGANGGVYSWGVNEVGPFGYPVCDSFKSVKNFSNVGSTPFMQREPRNVSQHLFQNKRVIKISIGESCAGAITEDCQLYMWGSNTTGQLGVGQLTFQGKTYSNILCPAIVSTFNKDLKILDLQVGYSHCIALCEVATTKERYVYSWGCSSNGQCGHEQNSDFFLPKRIQFFKDHKVEFVRAGPRISFVKSNEGLFEFGVNRKGLGKGAQKMKWEWWANVVDVSSNSQVDAFLVAQSI